MSERNHKLAAIVFTDVVGFTKCMEEDEQKTMQLLQRQRDIIIPLVKSYCGEIIKEMGDGFMIMFDSAIQAVRFAIETQTILKNEKFCIRAGIHIGDVIFKDDDIFGSAVNIAARIEPIASPNGICISEDVRTQLKNKSEITTISLGKKELKGLNDPIEVFEIFIEGVSEKKARSPGFIFRDLWSRRVIQILIAYIFGAWIIKFALAQIVSSYLLSPHLVDLAWTILLSLIPAICILSYFHGKRSSGKWNKIELFGLPANAFLSVLISVILFNGKDLGATISKVIVENEEGEQIERIVYKEEFRTKIALFQYRNISQDTSFYWIHYAIPVVVGFDLCSNLKIHFVEPESLLFPLMDAGYSLGDEIPNMLLRDIAKQYHLDYYITGSFTRNTDEYIILTNIYKIENAALISSFEKAGTDFFQLIDQTSAHIANELDADPGQIENSRDLPVSKIFTNSTRAMEYFIKGQLEVVINNNLDKAIYYNNKAISEDPDFALAKSILGGIYFQNNDLEAAEKALVKTMEIIYKLPEKHQFFTKYLFYVIKEEPDKALAVLKLWADIFPNDIEPHEILATRYQYRGDLQAAINEYKTIMALEAGQTDYPRYIADLYMGIGQMDSARMYYENYLAQSPDDYKAYRNFGEFYLKTGDFVKASEFIDKALILNSNDIEVTITKLALEERLGNYDNLDKKYIELLGTCTTIQDSNEVIEALSDFFEFRGMVEQSLNYHRKYISNAKNYLYPLGYEVLRAFNIKKYVIAGKHQEALEILKSCKEKLDAPVNKAVAFGYLYYYVYSDSIELAEPYMQEAWEMATGFGEEILLEILHFAKGHFYEAQNDFEKAIEEFELFRIKSMNKSDAFIHIARCQRKMGNFRKAKNTIQKGISYHPYAPQVNYEAYLIYKELGDERKANEHLILAHKIWENADDFYKPAQEVKINLFQTEQLF